MDISTCFGNIIGLTQKDCPCDENERPVDYNVSDSGYYVDDMEYGIQTTAISSARDCGEGSIWDLMAQARTEAIRDFNSDLSILIKQYDQSSFTPYDGVLGNYKESFNSTLTNISQFAGVKYSPIRYKGLSMILSQICGYFSQTGNVSVSLYSSLDYDTPIDTYVISAVSKKKSCYTLATPLNLPLSQNGSPINYYFVYDSTANKPMNVKWTCGCGYTPLLYTYMNGGGFSQNSLDLSAVSALSSYTNGIYPVVSIGCDTVGWLCRDWDYLTDPFGRVIANTVMFYSIMKLAGYILNSNRINFYTLLKREELYGKRSSMQKKISMNMDWMIENIPSGMSDCLNCNQQFYYKADILV